MNKKWAAIFAAAILFFFPITSNSQIWGGRVESTGDPFIVSPTGSPFTWQNPLNQQAMIVVSGGTLSAITVSRNGGSFNTLALLSGPALLAPGDSIRITYVVSPSLLVYPM
jgi:hypothetical protein